MPFAPGAQPGAAVLPRRAVAWPIAASTCAALVFALVRPGVPDLQAALARAAAAAHGVGLTYWFQWFGGDAVPGQYSVITPFASAVIGAPLLAALATAGATLALAVLVRGTPHAAATTWVGALTGALSLWSGRVPFAVGMLFAVLALLAVRHERRLPAALASAATVLASPVSGVFLGAAWAAVALRDPARRRTALGLLALCGLALLGLQVWFGTPGPAIFKPLSAAGVVLCALLVLLARPAPPVWVVAVATAVAAPVLLWLPTGMGSNLERMSTICLPVATVATAAARRWVVALVVAPAIAIAAGSTVHDLKVAAQPAASPGYYTALAAELDRLPDLASFRLEVVQSRSFHTASYALLDHAALATGWETQEQTRLDGVLTSPRLDPAHYRAWLDGNAVGYLALDRRARGVGDPEYHLVLRGLPFLRPVWHDATWTVLRVVRPTPIVAAPVRVVQATQARLTLHTARAARVLLRIRWSAYLEVSGPVQHPGATLTRRTDGWSQLTLPAAGTYTLSGQF